MKPSLKSMAKERPRVLSQPFSWNDFQTFLVSFKGLGAAVGSWSSAARNSSEHMREQKCKEQHK